MIVVDTSGLLAAIDHAQPLHADAKAALESDRGPFLLSPFVLAELDYMVSKKGILAELAFLLEVGRAAYQLEVMSSSDVEQAAEIIDRYRDLRIGLTDASIAILAARAGTDRVLTLDERHFRALRPLQGGAFTVLPADIR